MQYVAKGHNHKETPASQQTATPIEHLQTSREEFASVSIVSACFSQDVRETLKRPSLYRATLVGFCASLICCR